MATSTINSPAGGYSKGSFVVDPADGYYIAGISVVDGSVVSVTIKSVEHFFTAESTPVGFTVPSGDFSSDPTYSETLT